MSGRPVKVDLTGVVYGDFAVLRHVGAGRWELRCKCGAIVTQRGDSIRSGAARKSCNHGERLTITSRERDVAKLAATGLSNKEIAKRLAIGDRTVQTHMSSLFAKFGVGNRTELANALSGRVTP